MPWTEDGPHHGFTAGTPWLEVVTAPEGSAERQRATPGSSAHLIRDLIALGRELDGPVEELTAHDGVLSFRRGPHVVAVNTAREARPALTPGRVVVATATPDDGRLPAGAASVTLAV